MQPRAINKWICSSKSKTGFFLFLVLMAAIGLGSKMESVRLEKAQYRAQPFTAATYLETVVNQNSTLIFYKEGCPYCQSAEKILVKASKKSPYPTFFINLESEEGRLLKTRFNVRYAATLVAIRKGKATKQVYAKQTHGKYVPIASVLRGAFN